MKTPNGTWFPTLLVGECWRLLASEDVLQEGDETACLSLLTTKDPDFHEDWQAVHSSAYGTTVAQDLAADMDGGERLFRRRTHVLGPLPSWMRGVNP